MKSNTLIAALLLLLVDVNLAWADHVTVDVPSGFIQSAASVSDNSASDSSAPNTVSIGPADNPFNQSVDAGATIPSVTAQGTASQTSQFSSDLYHLGITSFGEAGGVTSVDPFVSTAQAISYSSFLLAFSLDEPFNFNLSADTNFENSGDGGGVVDVGLYTQFGTPIAFIGIDGSFPGAPTSGTLIGTLPAGNYQFQTYVEIQVDSGNNSHTSDAGDGGFSASFQAVDVAPEPTNWVLLAGGAASLLGFCRHRKLT